MENIIKESEMHGTKMKETETENWDRNNKVCFRFLCIISIAYNIVY